MKKFLLLAVAAVLSCVAVSAQEVTPPAKAQIEIYKGTSYSYAIYEDVEWKALVAVSGNQMYIKNIFPNMVNTKWVVGTITGSKVVFEGGQVIGDQDQAAMGGETYFSNCMLYGVTEEFEMGNASFSWNENTKTIKALDYEVGSIVNWTDEDGEPILAMNDGFDGTSDADATFTLVGTGEIYTEPQAVSYSLVGYINGADYGIVDDSENPGEHLFVDGKLTMNFTETSYVLVKTTDNAKWFYTQNYVPFAYPSTSASLVNGANFNEKMQVPAGEVEFTLTVNDDNTVTLVAAAEQPTTTSFFMKHPWGGGDWTWKEMTKDEENGFYTLDAQYGGNGVNVHTQASDSGAQWFAEPGLEGNPVVGDECTFYYYPENNYVVIVKKSETGINDMKVNASKVVKTIENGQVVIIKNGVRYNVMGQKF